MKGGKIDNKESERRVTHKGTKKKERKKKSVWLFCFRNDRRKQIGGCEIFWRHLIVPTGFGDVVGDRRLLVGVVLSVAIVPIHWRS